MPPPTKVQQRTLSVLRALLRHARAHLDASSPPSPLAAAAADAAAAAAAAPAPPAPQAPPPPFFSAYVLGEYRAARALPAGARARELRAAAAAALAYLEASAAQAALLRLQRGVDPDRPLQRRAVANLVGLDMPRTADGAVAAAQPARPGVGGRYVQGLRERLAGAGGGGGGGGSGGGGSGSVAANEAAAANLTGLDNLKAQLYGVQSPTLAAADAAEAAAAIAAVGTASADKAAAGKGGAAGGAPPLR
jgi:hypothetical protein